MEQLRLPQWLLKVVFDSAFMTFYSISVLKCAHPSVVGNLIPFPFCKIVPEQPALDHHLAVYRFTTGNWCRMVELTDHGGASCQRCLGALVEVIRRCHAAIWHLETRVYIDAAWHQHATVGIDGFHPTWHDEVFPNLSVQRNMTDNKTQ